MGLGVTKLWKLNAPMPLLPSPFPTRTLPEGASTENELVLPERAGTRAMGSSHRHTALSRLAVPGQQARGLPDEAEAA